MVSMVVLSIIWMTLLISGANSVNFSRLVSSSLLRHPSDTTTSTMDSHRATLNSISDKLQTQTLPIFEFGRDLDELLQRADDEAVSVLSVQQLYQRYVDALRDFYFQDFLNRCKQHGQRQVWCKERDTVLKEAEVAMKTALPSNDVATNRWYESQLEELRIDMESTIIGAWDENEDESAVATSTSKVHWLWSAKNKKRFKYILSQVLSVLLSFGQLEWHRRSTRRAAQKRLAEVPEFPLL